MKNLQLTQGEINQLFHLASVKEEECKKGTPKHEAYKKLANKLWEAHSNNK
ncbi:MAG: hypothetical protein Unbinned221contig1000_37 [Prokaryotic dsDNA virus sp.]|nr:MAG: hypothetical protein Unbinned221contig1000_37 [Prokaryotic dsDNA virus sp.]